MTGKSGAGGKTELPEWVFEMCPECGDLDDPAFLAWGRKSYKVECRTCGHEFQHGRAASNWQNLAALEKPYPVHKQSQIQDLIAQIVKAPKGGKNE